MSRLSSWGGGTYQEHIRGLSTLEDQIAFEMQHAGGSSIRDMVAWPYGHQGVQEWKYEDVVNPSGLKDHVQRAVDAWPVSKLEARVLKGLFYYYSVFGSGGRGFTHVRNPRPSQWRDVFTVRLQEQFQEAFPDALERLDYERF